MMKGFDARTDDLREKVSRIFGCLHAERLLESSVIKTAFDEQLEFIEDDVCDVPHIAKYMAQYIAQAVADGAIKLSFINEGFAHLVEAETISASLMACEVLKSLRTALADDAKLRQMFVDECDLLKCLPAESTRADLAKLLEREDLSFVDPKLSADVAKAREQEELGALDAYLKSAFAEEGEKSDEDISTWVQENTGSGEKVARHLLRALLETAQMSGDEAEQANNLKTILRGIEKRKGLLQKQMCDLRRQTNCLFEVQRYCHDAGWPPKSEPKNSIAKKLFYLLYKHDVVAEEAYNVWREDTDDPTPGKTKALVQVNEFLQWLENAASDDEDEEDED